MFVFLKERMNTIAQSTCTFTVDNCNLVDIHKNCVINSLVDYKHCVKSCFASHVNFGCRIAVSDERDMLLETGGGLRKAKSLLTGFQSPESGCPEAPILICNVDILSNIDIPTLLRAYNPNEMGVVVVYPRETQRYLVFDETHRLCGWTNIATGDVRGPIANTQYPIANTQNLAFSGMQVLNPRIFEVMDEVVKEKGDKFSLIDLYLSIAEKEILRAFIPENYRMMDVGKINQLAEAEAFAATLQL